MDIIVHNELKPTKIWPGGVLFALLLLAACQPIPALEITFGGDIMLAREGAALFDESPWAEFAEFGPKTHLAGESLFFANLESPLVEGKDTSQPVAYNLCADAEQVKFLKAGRLDLVVTANNHQMDCGEPPSTDTILDKVGILGVNAETSPVYIQTKVGVVGVIAADAIGEPLDFDTLLNQVDTAKDQSDFLVVSLHWGFEYAVGPGDTQREWAQELSDAGVDVLWGHHPHVLQPVEWVEASQGDHKMLAMYSLGNLLSDQWMTWETQHSTLITLRFTVSGIDSIAIHPTHLDLASRKLQLPSASSIEQIESRLGLDF